MTPTKLIIPHWVKKQIASYASNTDSSFNTNSFIDFPALPSSKPSYPFDKAKDSKIASTANDNATLDSIENDTIEPFEHTMADTELTKNTAKKGQPPIISPQTIRMTNDAPSQQHLPCETPKTNKHSRSNLNIHIISASLSTPTPTSRESIGNASNFR
jgi:hypothetical protein